MFKCSVEFFFGSSYSCLVLDDEMLGSKALDVETKIISGRKAAGEGPTCDCIRFIFPICVGYMHEDNGRLPASQC